MAYTEGQTATNKKTGQRIIYSRGAWRPLEEEEGAAEVGAPVGVDSEKREQLEALGMPAPPAPTHGGHPIDPDKQPLQGLTGRMGAGALAFGGEMLSDFLGSAAETVLAGERMRERAGLPVAGGRGGVAIGADAGRPKDSDGFAIATNDEDLAAATAREERVAGLQGASDKVRELRKIVRDALGDYEKSFGDTPVHRAFGTVGKAAPLVGAGLAHPLGLASGLVAMEGTSHVVTPLATEAARRGGEEDPEYTGESAGSAAGFLAMPAGVGAVRAAGKVGQLPGATKNVADVNVPRLLEAIKSSKGAVDRPKAVRALLEEPPMEFAAEQGPQISTSERLVRAESSRKYRIEARKRELMRNGLKRKAAEKRAREEIPVDEAVVEQARAVDEYKNGVEASRAEAGEASLAEVRSKPAAADGAADPAVARDLEIDAVKRDLRAKGFTEEIAGELAEKTVSKDPPTEAVRVEAEAALDQLPGVKPGMGLKEKVQLGIDALGTMNPEVAAIMTEGGVHAISSLARLMGIPVPFGIDWIVGRRAGGMVKGALGKARKRGAVAEMPAEAPVGRSGELLPGETVTPTVAGEMPVAPPTGAPVAGEMSTTLGRMSREAPGPVEPRIEVPRTTTQAAEVPEAIPVSGEMSMPAPRPRTAPKPAAPEAPVEAAVREAKVKEILGLMEKDPKFKPVPEKTRKSLAEEMADKELAGEASQPVKAPAKAPEVKPEAKAPQETEAPLKKKKASKEAPKEETPAEAAQRVAEDKEYGITPEDYTPVTPEGGGRKRLPLRQRTGPEITQEPITLKAKEGERASDAFRSWGYTPKNGGIVEVVGKNGDTYRYRYYGISKAKAEQFRTALGEEGASAGRILGKELRGEAKRTVRVEDTPLDKRPATEGTGGSSVKADLENTVQSNKIKEATGWEVERLGNDKYGLFDKRGKLVGEYDGLAEAVKNQKRRSKFGQKPKKKPAPDDTVAAKITEAEREAGIEWGEPLAGPKSEGVMADLKGGLKPETAKALRDSRYPEVMLETMSEKDGQRILAAQKKDAARAAKAKAEAKATPKKSASMRSGDYGSRMDYGKIDGPQEVRFRVSGADGKYVGKMKVDNGGWKTVAKGETRLAVEEAINGIASSGKHYGTRYGFAKGQIAEVRTVKSTSMVEDVMSSLKDVKDPAVRSLLEEVAGTLDAPAPYKMKASTVKSLVPRGLRGRVKQDGSQVTIKTGRGEIRLTGEGYIEITPETAGKWGMTVEEAAAKGYTAAGETEALRLSGDAIVRIVDENTIPHEMGHVFLDLFATKREAARINKALKAEAGRMDISTEEAFAEGYRKFFEADDRRGIQDEACQVRAGSHLHAHQGHLQRNQGCHPSVA
jgi:hypothetical protein